MPPIGQRGQSFFCGRCYLFVRPRLPRRSVRAKAGPRKNLDYDYEDDDEDLGGNQIALPLFEAQALFPPIRQETIHQVKGESIDAVLVLGSTKFWNSVIDSVTNGENSEDRRLAYVAMTRARHLLVVALPASHFDNHAEKWAAWGFGVL
jgi:superfamily I DNA/RNA helicase